LNNLANITHSVDEKNCFIKCGFFKTVSIVSFFYVKQIKRLVLKLKTEHFILTNQINAVEFALQFGKRNYDYEIL